MFENEHTRRRMIPSGAKWRSLRSLPRRRPLCCTESQNTRCLGCELQFGQTTLRYSGLQSKNTGNPVAQHGQKLSAVDRSANAFLDIARAQLHKGSCKAR